MKGCVFATQVPSPITCLPLETPKSSIEWDQGGKTKDLSLVQTLHISCHRIVLTSPSDETLALLAISTVLLQC